MKAIVIERFGGSEELVKRGLPRPTPRDGEVLIRVVAAGVSRLDVTACRGEARGSITVDFPWVPGFEVAGVVDQLGPGCRRFRTGDRVCALLPDGGGYAQFVGVKEDYVAPLPASLLFEEAAALPLDGYAVWSALFGDEPVDGSSTVIIRGASTGAGHLAVQIALAAGARVLVDAADDEEREFVAKLGHVEWLKATSLPAADCRIHASTSETCAEGWIDLSGGDGSLQACRLKPDRAREAAAQVSGLAERRRLRPRLFKILNIQEVVQTHRDLESGSTHGKLALTF